MTTFGQRNIRKKNSSEKRVVRLDRIIPKSDHTAEPIGLLRHLTNFMYKASAASRSSDTKQKQKNGWITEEWLDSTQVDELEKGSIINNGVDQICEAYIPADRA
jgi:hypothetical protein